VNATALTTGRIDVELVRKWRISKYYLGLKFVVVFFIKTDWNFEEYPFF
jgi:hypothetical protein